MGELPGGEATEGGEAAATVVGVGVLVSGSHVVGGEVGSVGVRTSQVGEVMVRGGVGFACFVSEGQNKWCGVG